MIVLIGREKAKQEEAAATIPKYQKKQESFYAVPETKTHQYVRQENIEQPEPHHRTRTTRIIHRRTFELPPIVQPRVNEINDTENAINGLGRILLGAVLAGFDEEMGAEFMRIDGNDILDANNPQQGNQNLNTPMRDDPQNTHDPQLIKDLRKELELIIEKNKEIANPEKYSLDDIRDYSLNANDETIRDKSQTILDVLDTIESNQLITTFNMGERDILLAVWQRADHPDNKDRKDLVRDAICQSIYECRNGMSVNHCIMGRATRFINSLSGVDASDDIGKATSSDFYKNEIFKTTRDILEKSVEEARNSHDPDLKAVGESYSDRSVVVDPKKEEEFIRSVKSEIAQKLDDLYGDKKIAHYNKYKEQALSGVDV